MKLSYSERKFIIDKLHKEGWKDKDIKIHLIDLDKNLKKVSKEIRNRELKEASFKKSNEYFKEEFNKLFE